MAPIHEAPGEDRPTVEITDLAQGLDEFHLLEIIIKHNLAASYAAIDVARRT